MQGSNGHEDGDQIEKDHGDRLPADKFIDREVRCGHRLMALLAHKRNATTDIGR